MVLTNEIISSFKRPRIIPNNDLVKKIKMIIDFINKNINPLYTINFKNLNVIKLIKKAFIFNYLIAGFIMISPVTNYINESIKESNINSAAYESFKNDYEVYKDIFFVGLIPYSLNYILKKEQQYE